MRNSTAKKIRKTVNVKRKNLANELVIELMQAPFRYRFKFAMKLLRGMKKGRVVTESR